MESSLPTLPHCIADFCLVPIGTPTASVSREVAEVQRLLKASGLSYTMHSAGTTVGTLIPIHLQRKKLLTWHFLPVEGSWDAVMAVIGQAHTMLHANGVVRIQSDIRVGTRTDKVQSFGDKVDAVKKLLEAEEKKTE